MLCTGEDIPNGQSLRARMLIIEVSPGDMNWDKLSHCQADGANGLYALAMAEFIQWLASRYESARSGLKEELAELRAKAHQSGMHKRIPELVANLALGWRYFLDFAEEVGAITKERNAELWQQGWKALGEAAAKQEAFQAAGEPTQRFLELLAAALASGRAHVTDPKGADPPSPSAWGWKIDYAGYSPGGDRIGYVDGDDLYLIPETSYQVAQRGAGGEGVGVNPKTLSKRLDEKGLLRSKEPRRNTVRKDLAGARRNVLHLHKDSLIVTRPRLSIKEQIAVLDVLIDLTDGRGEEFVLPNDLIAKLAEQCAGIAVIDLNELLQGWGFEKRKTKIYGAPLDAWHLVEARIRELREALSDSPQAATTSTTGDDYVH